MSESPVNIPPAVFVSGGTGAGSVKGKVVHGSVEGAGGVVGDEHEGAGGGGGGEEDERGNKGRRKKNRHHKGGGVKRNPVVLQLSQGR